MSVPAYDTKEQVRQATDIVDLVGSSLPLRRQGRNFVALCPWHADSRPSLQVNPERQSWKCWVCDIGGDVFSFIMKREGVDFREALQMLADRAGIELLPTKPGPIVEAGSARDKKMLYAAMEWAQQQFHRYLVEAIDAEVAREYLRERGISQQSVERYHLGFAPNEWQWLVERAAKTPYKMEVLDAVGLAKKSEKSGRWFDFFRGRVIFPVRDTQNRPIAFGGRILPQFNDGKTGKYMNSPETRLFQKSEQLYGLDVAANAVSRSRHIVVMEGYTDVIMANQFGVENVVAVCGTAIGASHVQPRSLLRRHADRITLLLDGDEAGQKRSADVLEMFIAENIDLRVATLPGGLDPCDFLLEQGAEPLQQIIDEAPNALEYKIDVETRNLNVARDSHGANRALENILRAIAKAPRLTAGSQSGDVLRMRQLLSQLARRFNVTADELFQRISEIRTESKSPETPIPAEAAEATSEQLGKEEAELLEVLLLKPQLAERAIDEVDVMNLKSSSAQQIFSVYRELVAAGEHPDYARVQTELEDPKLKNVLASLDWLAHEAAPRVGMTPETWLDSLIRFFEHRRAAGSLKAVHSGQLAGADALELVRRFIEQERSRQGLSKPTDG